MSVTQYPTIQDAFVVFGVVRQGKRQTMAGSEPSNKVVKAIAKFVATLPAAPSLLAARQEETSKQAIIAHGKSLFQKQGCVTCHDGRQFTSTNTYDVGIHDEEEMTVIYNRD